MNFKDKVVLITGAGKGRGKLAAEILAAQGAIIAVNDISPINVEQVMNDIIASGGKAKAYVEDIAKKVGTQTVVKQVEDEFGQIDILINHAAVEPHAPLLDMDEWDWHRVMDVNLTGMFLATQSVGRMMRAQGSGVILNLVSAAGRGEVSKRGAYLTSMAGAMELTLQSARELHPVGVHVHAITSRFPELQQHGQNYPLQYKDAVLYLCSTNETGLIVNLE